MVSNVQTMSPSEARVGKVVVAGLAEIVVVWVGYAILFIPNQMPFWPCI